MNVEEIRLYCLNKPGVTEGFPFNDTVLVFKVMDKMFALLALDEKRINLKFDPEDIENVRLSYEDVIPGYHMSKNHWNTIILEGKVTSEKLKEWIDDSYQLIVESLPRKKRQQLNELSK